MGKKLSEEHKRNISEALKGKTAWNKGKENIYSEETIKKMSKSHKGHLVTEKTRKKISEKNKGRKLSEEHKTKLRNAHLGKIGYKHTEQTKRKIGESNKGYKSNLWKGGIQYEPYTLKFSNKFKRAIRKRDNQVCMLCNIHKEKLNRTLDVHHVNYDKLLSIPQNCISLCRSCHAKTGFNRKQWIYFFQSLLFKKYNYQYSEGKVIINWK